MKVLHLCSYYIGSELYKNLMINLESLNIENDVYIPVNSKELIGRNTYEKFDNTSLIYSNCYKKIDRFSFKIKSKKTYKDLIKRVKLDNIDIVHAHSLFTNGYLAYKLKEMFGIDYIVAVRNTDINIFYKFCPHMRNLGLKIMKNAKKVIFISHSYKYKMLKSYIPKSEIKDIESKMDVIPNGVDYFWFDNMFIKKEQEKEKIKFLYVGEFNKNKNVLSIIKATKELRNKGYQVELELVGEGKYLNRINKLIKDEVDYITISGKLVKEELIKKYRECDLFIMPSKYETFGLVYVEALTQGVPIIYTRGQGFDGYFNDGEVGFSVEYGNLDELINTMELFIKSNVNICEYENDIKQKFMWKSVCEKYISIYNE